MRKILEERLENARNDYYYCSFESTLRPILKGQIEAYQDCLNLLPQPRTEQEILKDFEALGWKVYTNNNEILCLNLEGYGFIAIDKIDKSYRITRNITMQEHKLLNELFSLWSWI